MYGRATSDGYQNSRVRASPVASRLAAVISSLAFCDVVGRQAERLVELGRRRHPVVGRLGQARIERVDVRLPVDGVADRLADVDVVERLVVGRLVHRRSAEVARLAAVDDLELRCRDLSASMSFGAIVWAKSMSPACEGIELGGLVGIRLEDDLVEMRDPVRVPVVRVLHDRDVVVRCPFLELERTGADQAVALPLGVRALGSDRGCRRRPP